MNTNLSWFQSLLRDLDYFSVDFQKWYIRSFRFIGFSRFTVESFQDQLGLIIDYLLSKENFNFVLIIDSKIKDINELKKPIEVITKRLNDDLKANKVNHH